jgi:uncharacterized membrane protein
MNTELAAHRWYTARPDQVRRHWGIVTVTMFCLALGAEIAAAAFTSLALVPLPLLVAAVVLAAVCRRMPVRTAAGTALASQAQGFRSYLKITVVQQACSAGQPGLLYDYLPYAIAFGCTKQWATMSAALPSDAGPSWYQPAGFAPVTPFIPAIHHFATAANSTGITTSSGFSGIAGGGGGGGGGGSW